uniref:Uncharacterized protein n=1 Tax=Nothoprocta perdicaria TaxID=30464 RepID=A0A8C6Z329_NOTPE
AGASAPGRWALAASSAVTLVLHALLLATLYTSDDSDSGPSVRGVRVAVGGGAGASAGDRGHPTPPLCAQAPRAERSLNYSSLRFPAPAADYENMKTGPDYVNVDPKKKKADFWTCSGSAAAKAIEYTEVKL